MPLDLWSDSAVALLTHGLIATAKRYGWAMTPSYDEGFVMPDRTRRRHRPESIAYPYERIARNIDVRRLIERGRSRGAALRWLQRHQTDGLHWWDAPRPRRKRKAGDCRKVHRRDGRARA